jgi:hypothetical protein
MARILMRMDILLEQWKKKPAAEAGFSWVG